MNKGDRLASGARSANFNAPTAEMEGTQVWPADAPVELTEGDMQDDQSFNPPRQFVELPDKPKVGYRGQPVGDSVLVQRVEREHSSNLVLPDSMKSKSEIGYIVAVGKKVKLYKQGQMVLFDKFASHGADIELVDEDGIERKYLLLKEYDLLMTLTKVNVSSPAQ